VEEVGSYQPLQKDVKTCSIDGPLNCVAVRVSDLLSGLTH
jgi:hypothetical protein